MSYSISNINSSKLSKNFTSKKAMSSQTEDVLISLMKEMGLKSRLQTDILECVSIGQSLPFIPKEFIKHKNKEALETNMKSKMLKLPTRPIQRTKTQIEQSGSYDIEKYRPNPSQTRPPREKERLQNIMAFGQDFEEKVKTVSKNVVNSLEPQDLFDEILMEIKERKEFLDEMFQLGLGKKYLPEIQCQIALRLKELEKLDKSRAERIMSEYDL